MVTKKSSSKKILLNKPLPGKAKDTSLAPTAVAALILTICALLFSWIPFLGLLFGVLGLTFGILAYRDSKGSSIGTNFGIGTIIVSSLVLIFQIVMIIGLMVAFTTLNLADSFEGNCVANSTSMTCDNVSLSLAGSVFNLDVKTDDSGEVLSVDLNARAR